MSYTSTRGFTLVETLVAITILTLALIGPFYAVQNALFTSFLARDSLIAAALAQEAIEFIRSKRDDAIITNPASAWSTFLTSISMCRPGPCVVDPTQGVPDDISSSVDRLYLSSTNLYNQQGAGTGTRFTRTIEVTDVSATQVKIEVTVTWITSQASFFITHGTYTIVLTEHLHRWASPA